MDVLLESNMTQFLLRFDDTNYWKVFLLAVELSRRGNRGDWFWHAQRAIEGFYARIKAVITHYHQLHAWPLRPKVPHEMLFQNSVETDYHVASILFGMDSAIECFVFMLNAMGCAVSVGDFHDMADEKALRRIAPSNVVGNAAVPGYAKHFPRVVAHWTANEPLLKNIRDQHDVSKHRSSSFAAGTFRNDPPPGFYEFHRVSPEDAFVAGLIPRERVRLLPDPKLPISQTRTGDLWLEPLVEEFRAFMDTLGARAYEDAAAILALKAVQPSER